MKKPRVTLNMMGDHDEKKIRVNQLRCLTGEGDAITDKWYKSYTQESTRERRNE